MVKHFLSSLSGAKRVNGQLFKIASNLCSNLLENYKEKESSGGPKFRLLLLRASHCARHKETGHLNIQPPAHPTLYKPGHDNKAYLIGQQLLQSMPQSLAKSRTNPVVKTRSLALATAYVTGQLPRRLDSERAPQVPDSGSARWFSDTVTRAATRRRTATGANACLARVGRRLFVSSGHSFFPPDHDRARDRNRIVSTEHDAHQQGERERS